MLESGDVEHVESIVTERFPLRNCGSWNRIKKVLESCQQPITNQGSDPSEIAAAEKLCKIYFEIAASCIGEEEVRKRVAAATSAVA